MGGIQMLGKSDAEQIRANARTGRGRVSLEMPFEVLAHHAVDFWLCGEDLPLPENRVTLENDGRIRLTLDERTTPRAQAPAPRAAAPAQRPRHAREAPAEPQHLHAQGHADRRDRAPGRHDPVRHRPGELRARRELPAHEVDNLYVVDTSFFPSIGAVNPSLTAIANALRVGDHVLERLG